MDELVRLEREGDVARMTLNQPAKLNAINDAMWTRLDRLFAELDADESLRCVILQGAGDKAFCVGADISEFERNRSDIDRARRYHERTHAAMSGITSCRHPTIAKVHGLCVGGGLELATMCDLRIAGRSARFGIPVKRLGLVVAHTELQPLVDLIGPANAMEILLEGQIFGAERACHMGLVNRVVPDEELEAEVQATAGRIAEGAPLVARWHKRFTHRLMERDPLTPAELDESFDCFETEDFRIGYRAFLEKRKPEFRGR